MREVRRPWLWATGIFVVIMIIFVIVGAPIQMALGLWGVAITELMLLIMAFAAAKLMRYPFRETFLPKMPRANQVVGTIVATFAAMLVNVTLALIIFYFFPEGMQVAESLSSLALSLPLPIVWVIMAVFPAVCEEALHRGFIYQAFRRSFQNKWAVIGWMGFIFGVFHLDPYRFIPTAFIGAMLTYLMVETDNIFLPMIYHMVNNTISVASSQLQPAETAALLENPEQILAPAVVGLYLILGAFGVLALRGGIALVKYRDRASESEDPEVIRQQRQGNRTSWVITGIIALLMFVVGCIVLASDMGNFSSQMEEIMLENAAAILRL